MKRAAVALMFVFSAWAIGAPAWAIIVFRKNQSQPITGHFVCRDDGTLVIDQRDPGGPPQLLKIPLSEVEDVIHAVSEERLAQLDPSSPKEYRLYAEELAEKRSDPDARETAIRLYLTAAHLAPDDLGRSSLLGMIGLARSAAEERKFRAMAYLLDPDHDVRLLKAPSAKATPAGPTPESRSSGGAEKSLASALRMSRKGLRQEALGIIKRPDIQQALSKYRSIIAPAELELAISPSCPGCEKGKVKCEACEGAGYKTVQAAQVKCPECRGVGLNLCDLCGGHYARAEPSTPLMRKLLALEVALTSDPSQVAAPAQKEASVSLNWARAAMRGGGPPIPSLTLTTLTEFDPRKCVYRDGEWVAP